MAFKAKFLNRDAVMQRLRRVVPNAERELAAAQLTSAKQLADAVRTRAPVETGVYKDHLIGARLDSRRLVGLNGRNLGLKGLKGLTKDPNATGLFAWFTWRWLEFGTVNMARQPHIFPTYRAMKRKIRRNMANAVNKAVRRSKR